MIQQKIGDAVSVPGEPAVFKDDNPDAAPDARYKALLPANRLPQDHRRGLIAFKSPDGIHWSPMSDKQVITAGAFDSQNLAFWDAEHGLYRAYRRDFTKGGDDQKEYWNPQGDPRFAPPLRKISSTGRHRSISVMSIHPPSNSTPTRSSRTFVLRTC